jgi:hypothetical protein
MTCTYPPHTSELVVRGRVRATLHTGTASPNGPVIAQCFANFFRAIFLMVWEETADAISPGVFVEVGTDVERGRREDRGARGERRCCYLEHSLDVLVCHACQRERARKREQGRWGGEERERAIKREQWGRGRKKHLKRQHASATRREDKLNKCGCVRRSHGAGKVSRASCGDCCEGQEKQGAGGAGADLQGSCRRRGTSSSPRRAQRTARPRSPEAAAGRWGHLRAAWVPWWPGRSTVPAAGNLTVVEPAAPAPCSGAGRASLSLEGHRRRRAAMGEDEAARGQRCGGAGARGGAHRHVWALKLGVSPETRHGRRIASHRIACTASWEVGSSAAWRSRVPTRGPIPALAAWSAGKACEQGRRFSASRYAVGPTVLRRVMLRRQVMLLRWVLLRRRILLRRRWLLGVAAKRRRLLLRRSAKRSAPGRSGLVLPHRAHARPHAEWARAPPAFRRWRLQGAARAPATGRGRRAPKGLLRRARRGSAAAQTCICETGAAGGGTSPGGKVPSPLDIFPSQPALRPWTASNTHARSHTQGKVRGCQRLAARRLPGEDWTVCCRTGPSKHKEICRRVQMRWATGRGRAMCQ